MGSKVWITWHYQARSRNLAKALNLEIKEYFQNNNIFIRHLFSSIWTIKILHKDKPRVIFIQYSFLLLLLLYVYKKLAQIDTVLVVDCHTKALRRKAPGLLNIVFWPLKKLSFNAADLTIISNEGLTKRIKELHDNFIILPDMIPQIKFGDSEYQFKDDYCVYISSFAVDEPFEEMLEVSQLLENSYKLFWTGKVPKKNENLVLNYPNIHFTGYVSYDEYYNLIKNAKCLIALTTEEDCLQSGAYEAISVEVPVVLSDTISLRKFFGSTATYTRNEPLAICNAINTAISQSDTLIAEMQNLKLRRKNEFEKKIETILKYINSK
ncbi:MAG: glycosyltransferase [Ignavibacteria bacterium]|nr:glycosyltransferase [Ignavibacteria bacterium]